MSFLDASLIYLVLPFCAALLPVMYAYLRRRGIAPALPALRSNGSYQAVSPLASGDLRPAFPRLKVCAASALLAISMFTAMGASFASVQDGLGFGLQLRDGLIAGLGGGALIVFCCWLASYFRSALRAGRRLQEIGAVSTWGRTAPDGWLRRRARGLLSAADEFLARAGIFETQAPNETGVRRADLRKAIGTAVNSNRTLDAICTDGVDVLALLAFDPSDLAKGPPAHLRDARLRLLVLPPRNGRVDPDRKKLSCAEVALSKIDRSPEDQWRHLRESFGLLKVWTGTHGVQIDVRFIESRPAFRCLLAGERVWAATWSKEPKTWIEFAGAAFDDNFARGFHDYFAGEWAIASKEIDLPLNEGATGSTIIRKGIEIHEEQLQSG